MTIKKTIHWILCKFKILYILKELGDLGGLNLKPHSHYPNTLTNTLQVGFIINTLKSMTKWKPYTEFYASLKFSKYSKELGDLGELNLEPLSHYPNTLTTIAQVVLINNTLKSMTM